MRAGYEQLPAPLIVWKAKRFLRTGIRLLAGDGHRALDVQSPRFAVVPETVKIIKTVGQVGVLLDLAQNESRSDCVQRTGWNEKSLPLAGFDPVQVILDFSALRGPAQLIAG